MTKPFLPAPQEAGTVIASRAAALQAAVHLSDGVRARTGETETSRRIPDETIGELLDSGLFNILTPKHLGGSEIGFAALVEVTAELASACGSTGWVYGVLAGHSWMLHLFPEQAQQDVFSNPRALTATTFRLGGEMTEVDGGYRLTNGEGRFCSGIDFASWVIVGGAVSRPDGSKEPRFFLVPREDIEVIDDWFTAGMRGTGSRSIRIRDAFVPEYRSLSVADMLSGAAPGVALNPGPLYRHSFSYVTPFSIVGAPIGMARGAMRSVAGSMTAALARSGPEQVVEQHPAIIQLAESATEIDAAYAMVMADAEQLDRANGAGDISEQDAVRIPRNWAYGVQTARRAANRIFEISGGASIYNTSDVQRFWRDVNAASQHRAFSWAPAMTDYGRVVLGVKPVGYKLKPR